MSERDVVVDPDKLTAILADRLAAIIPDGFEVRASDGMLWYSYDAGRFPGQLNRYDAGGAGTYVRHNFYASQEDSSDADSAAWVGEQTLDAAGQPATLTGERIYRESFDRLPVCS